MTDTADLLTRAEAEARNIFVPDAARKVIAELMAALRGQDKLMPDWVNERIVELEQQLKEQSEARERLENVIRDIDAHATPIGLLDANDPEGSPAYYVVTVGALHRALGKSGTAPKCPAPEVVAALDEFIKEMQERVIPDIVRAVAERQVLANEARQRILLALELLPKPEAV